MEKIVFKGEVFDRMRVQLFGAWIASSRYCELECEMMWDVVDKWLASGGYVRESDAPAPAGVPVEVVRFIRTFQNWCTADEGDMDEVEYLHELANAAESAIAKEKGETT
jgi:hypothetical protein